jgi:hypothetical protein
LTPVQFSEIDVQTLPGGGAFQRLTSSAGGQDDGVAANGALITAGGIGDTNANPPPFAPPADFNVPDDELYDLLPFYSAGDLLVNVRTINPSNDDNIFFAAFCISGRAEVTVGCAVVPPSHDFGMVILGQSADTNFDIVNTGDAPINGDVTENCDHFSIVAGGGAYALANNGDSHTVTIRFEPTAVGQFHCDIMTGNSNCPIFEAWGEGEMVIPAAVQFFDSRWTDGHVELAWTLIDMTVAVTTEISRRGESDINYLRLYDVAVDQTGNDFTFQDYGTMPGQNYSYRVVIRENGDQVAQFITSINTPASRFELGQNHPNPFNPATSIPFTLSDADHVTLMVYDISGRLVSTLVDRQMAAGTHTAQWDGRDTNGNTVATGVYFYRLRSGSNMMTRKAILMK